MGIHTSESDGISNSSLGNSESIGEAAIILIAIGSILIVLCAASIVYGLHRRRRSGTNVTGGMYYLNYKHFYINKYKRFGNLLLHYLCNSIQSVQKLRQVIIDNMSS